MGYVVLFISGEYMRSRKCRIKRKHHQKNNDKKEEEGRTSADDITRYDRG